jgi:hypothetical protein
VAPAVTEPSPLTVTVDFEARTEPAISVSVSVDTRVTSS